MGSGRVSGGRLEDVGGGGGEVEWGLEVATAVVVEWVGREGVVVVVVVVMEEEEEL